MEGEIRLLVNIFILVWFWGVCVCVCVCVCARDKNETDRRADKQTDREAITLSLTVSKG